MSDPAWRRLVVSRRTTPYASFIAVGEGIPMMKRAAEIGLGVTGSDDIEPAGIDAPGEAVL